MADENDNIQNTGLLPAQQSSVLNDELKDINRTLERTDRTNQRLQTTLEVNKDFVKQALETLKVIQEEHGDTIKSVLKKFSDTKQQAVTVGNTTQTTGLDNNYKTNFNVFFEDLRRSTLGKDADLQKNVTFGETPSDAIKRELDKPISNKVTDIAPEKKEIIDKKLSSKIDLVDISNPALKKLENMLNSVLSNIDFCCDGENKRRNIKAPGSGVYDNISTGFLADQLVKARQKEKEVKPDAQEVKPIVQQVPTYTSREIPKEMATPKPTSVVTKVGPEWEQTRMPSEVLRPGEWKDFVNQKPKAPVTTTEISSTPRKPESLPFIPSQGMPVGADPQMLMKLFMAVAPFLIGQPELEGLTIGGEAATTAGELSQLERLNRVAPGLIRSVETLPEEAAVSAEQESAWGLSRSEFTPGELAPKTKPINPYEPLPGGGVEAETTAGKNAFNLRTSQGTPYAESYNAVAGVPALKSIVDRQENKPSAKEEKNTITPDTTNTPASEIAKPPITTEKPSDMFESYLRDAQSVNTNINEAMLKIASYFESGPTSGGDGYNINGGSTVVVNNNASTSEGGGIQRERLKFELGLKSNRLIV